MYTHEYGPMEVTYLRPGKPIKGQQTSITVKPRSTYARSERKGTKVRTFRRHDLLKHRIPNRLHIGRNINRAAPSVDDDNALASLSNSGRQFSA